MSTDLCNVIIVITALLLALLGFSKELTQSSPKLVLMDDLWFKVVVVALCVLLGGYATVEKENNADASSRQQQAVLKSRHDSDSTALSSSQAALDRANRKIDTLRDTLEAKERRISDQGVKIIQAQNDALNEIKGGVIPFISGGLTNSEEGQGFKVTVINTGTVPIANLEVSYNDAFSHRWRDTSFFYAVHNFERVLVVKNSSTIKDGQYLYFFVVLWRRGFYEYTFNLHCTKGKLTIENVRYMYNHAKYSLADFRQKYLPDQVPKNQPKQGHGDGSK